MPEAQPTPPTVHALRVAVAATVCLALAEWWRLSHGNLAVYSAFMAMAQFTYTAFQKGFERVVGRGAGILVGLVILPVFFRAPLLAVVLRSLALLAFFYVAFSGRLAYTFLNAGLYLAVTLEIGRADPPAAPGQGLALFVAVLLGVLVADLTMWLTGGERDVSITPGGEPLLPLRGAWVWRAVLLIVTVELTLIATRWLGLPASQSVISVMVLATAADLHAQIRKGELRLAGAVMGSAWALGSFLLLSRVPHFLVLAALLFLGIYLAAYFARTWGNSAYAGVQMGLVIPLVLVVPASEFGSMRTAVLRVEGVVAALAASVLVGGIGLALAGRAAPSAAVPVARP